MTERPILFSAPMIRAILAGTKSQTRRVVKPRLRGAVIVAVNPQGMPIESKAGIGSRVMSCPYGAPGDRLWVRETWAVPHRYDHLGPSNIPASGVPTHYAASEERGGLLWRPSIHMCRWASRITLEVTGVRVERLQDISEADAKAEGISEFIGGWRCEHDDADQIAGMTPQEGYRFLWERINGAGSWDANPWVWVVEYRRLNG